MRRGQGYKVCQCEHVLHMATDTITDGIEYHEYRARRFQDLVVVRTAYGTYSVCQECKTAGHMRRERSGG